MNIGNKNISVISDFFLDKTLKKACLLGSLIRNEVNDDSDIDLLVRLDYSQPISIKFIKMKLDLQDILNKK